jgi:hypothetical protein
VDEPYDPLMRLSPTYVENRLFIDGLGGFRRHRFAILGDGRRLQERPQHLELILRLARQASQ